METGLNYLKRLSGQCCNLAKVQDNRSCDYDRYLTKKLTEDESFYLKSIKEYLSYQPPPKADGADEPKEEEEPQVPLSKEPEENP